MTQLMKYCFKHEIFNGEDAKPMNIDNMCKYTDQGSVSEQSG